MREERRGRETRDRAGETREGGKRKARASVYARTLLMSVCIEYRWW